MASVAERSGCDQKSKKCTSRQEEHQKALSFPGANAPRQRKNSLQIGSYFTYIAINLPMLIDVQ